MQIDVWSDVVCPWCYIGKRRLEAALARFPHAAGVTVVFHSFELDPNAPKRSELSLTEMLSKKYGMPVAKAAEMERHVSSVAKQDGLDFHFEDARPENTFDAHRLIHLGQAHGRQADVKERMMRAYFTEGRRLGDPEELVKVGVEAGLDEVAVRAVVADPVQYRDAVRADEARARELGIRGVPFFVVDGKYGISGAQPADTLLGALTRAWSERPVEVQRGDVCDDDGCALPES